MLDFSLSDSLREKLRHLKKKDPSLFEAAGKKILQIASSDESTIQHYKNLRGSLSHLKRVHVGSFVLTFKLKENLILFEDLEHHDNAYKR
jgi:mRNA-degrading endonuclease RelE of RelBE toxin-antitoxin system